MITRSLDIYHLISFAGGSYSTLSTFHHCPPIGRDLARGYELLCLHFHPPHLQMWGLNLKTDWVMPNCLWCPLETSANRLSVDHENLIT